MLFKIEAILADKVGFASHQNAVPIIRELEVASTAPARIENLTLTLSADPPFLSGKTWRIDRLSPGDHLHIADRDVALSASFLSNLTEAVTGTVTIRLLSGDDLLAETTTNVTLLARTEWGGSAGMAELLPAFAMPNDPAVDRVLKAASDALRRAGRPNGLDGYLAQSRERVWELTSAIWSAVCSFQISYTLPPASFERQGQRVRTPTAILEGRVATCLDTALLFAAALEQAGLNPLLILTRGHAFVGVWLQPIEFAALITDEAAALRRRIDLKDLLVFETTLATQSPPPGLGQAEKTALRLIAEDATDPFEMAIDIRRARMQKIRPLGVVGETSASASVGAMPVSEAMESAPTLPGFDVDVPESSDTVTDRIGLWQRKLLNLTTSNRLLNVPEGGKVVRLACPEPGALEDLLAAGRKIKIVAMPDLKAGGRDEKLFEAQTNENLSEEYARAALGRGEVVSLIEKGNLDAALVDLYRKARSDMDEGGANTLFLALGFLKWKKSASDPRTYRAPLILLPVKLERKSALSGVVMALHEDEPRFNLTLLELLRQDFELTIPELEGPLPADDSGVDVTGIWTTVRRAVRDIAGFEVTEDLVVGTFSFAKYLMWKDLVDRSDRLKESPVVKHLIERTGDGFGSAGVFPRPEHLDAKVDPAELFAPLPADSSQLSAVVASAQGHNFVLDGPPGTGKSQTIANIIAHNLAMGRRVLFVAEKMAALDVVQRRLAEKGLGEFCLELHSSKASKLEVLKQLDRAWTTRETMTADEWTREAAEVRRLRNGLNGLASLLHRREPNGLTIHAAIGRVVRDCTEATPQLIFASGAVHTEQDLTRFRDIARRLGLARREVADLPAAIEVVNRSHWSNGWQEQIVTSARKLLQSLQEFQAARDAVVATTSIVVDADSGDGSDGLLTLCKIMLETYRSDFRFAFAPDADPIASTATSAITKLTRYRIEEKSLSATYSPEAVRRINVPLLRSEWDKASGKFWFMATIAQKKIARSLTTQAGVSSLADPQSDLLRLEAMTEALAEFDPLSAKLSGLGDWAGLATDLPALEAKLHTAQRLRDALAATATAPSELIELRRVVSGLVIEGNDLLGPDGRIAKSIYALDTAAEDLTNSSQVFNGLAESEPASGFAALRDRADAVIANQHRLNAWTNWRRVQGEATSVGLQPLVRAVESSTVAPQDTGLAFDTAYCRWFAGQRIDAEPLLSGFVSAVHDDDIAAFRRLEDRLAELSVRYIRAKICGIIPDKEGVGRKDGYAVLKHQLQLQRRHKPVRQLAVEMGDAFTRLAPCMLMSPLSIAQYLPADQALFDLVIFDEASQIAPWDAIGAMARGTQVIIAGDPRQMPPTSFFTRAPNSSDTDVDTEEDMESILDECLAAGVPQHGLSWHYRSRHESLIAFSNHRYYDDCLVTFPASVTRASAVEWRRVEGVYARGKGRINQVEAQALVNEAVVRLTDPDFIQAGYTLGIITLNADQQRLVEDLLDVARRNNPAIEAHFGEDRTEPVVVKNLETVQGDERDVILLGIGFGPTEPGGKTMSMAFGALNANGGWRRLNVAVTRARREMLVFTSFDPGMIDLNRTSARAVRDLKHFIEFADRGPRALAEAVQGSVGPMESPFEEAVSAALMKKGWTVVPQIGVSRFRIDLGIVHPDRPGDYLVGVECDGASYHSAATARDRDKVRAAILEGLGWKLLRVWSTDWWIDKAGATDRLHVAIEALLAASREAAKTVGNKPLKAVEIPVAAEDLKPLDEGASLDVRPFDRPETDQRELLAVVASDKADDRPPLLAKQMTTSENPRGSYRITDFSAFASKIDASAFYEDGYDSTLAELVCHVLECEAPLSEPRLVERIARAHGFQRAGRLIRERVAGVVARSHHSAPDGLVGHFVWLDAESAISWQGFRLPASADDIRQIEEIASVELRYAMAACLVEDKPVEAARRFGIRRLTTAARQRLEHASIG